MRQSTVLFRIIGVLVAAILIAWVFYAAKFASSFVDWTGFAADTLPPNTTATPVVIYQQNKTLWDWLQLLLVPLVLAVGGFYLTRSENRYALQLQERQEQETRKLEAQRAQDAALQAYLDQMTHLLLHENLRKSSEDDEVRSVARARTLTVLRVLDGEEKISVLEFLYEAGLIGHIIEIDNDKYQKIEAVLSLARADLSGLDLSGKYFDGINLSGTNLSKTTISGNRSFLNSTSFRISDFIGANLSQSNLSGADFSGANFSQTDLSQTDLTYTFLREAILHYTNLTKANLTSADLTGAQFNWTKLEKTNFRYTILDRAVLTFCHITDEQLAQAASLEGTALPQIIIIPEDYTTIDDVDNTLL